MGMRENRLRVLRVYMEGIESGKNVEENYYLVL